MSFCSDMQTILSESKKDKVLQTALKTGIKASIKQALIFFLGINAIVSGIIAGLIFPSSINTNTDLFLSQLSKLDSELKKESPDNQFLKQHLDTLKDALQGIEIEQDVPEECLNNLKEIVKMLDVAII